MSTLFPIQAIIKSSFSMVFTLQSASDLILSQGSENVLKN